MRLLNLFAISLLCFTLFVACSSTPPEGVEVLSCKDFEQKMKATESLQLVDVRTPEEFAEGTIETAINIDYHGEGFKEKMKTLDLERPIFVFCAIGGRSSKASAICKDLGFKGIYDLDGGYEAWSQYKK